MSVPEKSYEDAAASAKRDLLEHCVNMQKELEQRQRKYKKVLLNRTQNRAEQIIGKSYAKTINRLQSERNDLRAQIWVAGSRGHTLQNERYLQLVKCHIKCQEKLTAEIQNLKTQTSNLENYIGRTDKAVYKLNLKTIPDEQHTDFVKQMRKKLLLLENRLEVGLRRECELTAANAALRREVQSLLLHREFSNSWFMKLVHQLSTDNKYLLDLMKYAGIIFDDCINCQEKVDYTIKKSAKEKDNLKDDMQTKLRKSANSDSIRNFTEIKNKTRYVQKIQPKEIRRRKEFVVRYSQKIRLYNSVLTKLLKYTHTQGGFKSVEGIIEIFSNQENLYYSYCSIANEMSFHITLLNNAVNQLYKDINDSKINSEKRTSDQSDEILKLEQILLEKRKKNEELRNTLETKENKLHTALQNVAYIFNKCRCSTEPLKTLLGNYSDVNIYNMRVFFKMLETRIVNIVAAVYVTEHQNPQSMEKCIVQDIFKIKDELTDLEDIVLTQQCPECAEGEALNVDDVTDDGIEVYTKEKAANLLIEKVIQPEMQYRLHSISQCRLPRSRLLAAKRAL